MLAHWTLGNFQKWVRNRFINTIVCAACGRGVHLLSPEGASTMDWFFITRPIPRTNLREPFADICGECHRKGTNPLEQAKVCKPCHDAGTDWPLLSTMAFRGCEFFCSHCGKAYPMFSEQTLSIENTSEIDAIHDREAARAKEYLSNCAMRFGGGQRQMYPGGPYVGWADLREDERKVVDRKIDEWKPARALDHDTA